MTNRKPITSTTNIGTVTLDHTWWLRNGKGLDSGVTEIGGRYHATVSYVSKRIVWTVSLTRETPTGALRAAINAAAPMLTEAQKRALTRVSKARGK